MDELRYSLRSLEKNLPWHEGTIFIVSPNQVPNWLNTDHPRVKIIDQASLLPPSANPTFNSFSIEFYLDKIPGLTERFIQLNDDYFFKRYIHPSFFFNKKRFPNFYYGRTHVHKGFKEADQISILENATWIKKYCVPSSIPMVSLKRNTVMKPILLCFNMLLMSGIVIFSNP